MADKIRRCPKCKGVIAGYTEEWGGHVIDFEANDRGWISPNEEGYLNPGNPYRVLARCGDCLHTWTVRGALQITSVTEAKPHTNPKKQQGG